MTQAHARWYDAGQGRFVSRDPLGGGLRAPASQNRYAYALDNPTTLMDPNGLGTISGAGGGVGGGGPVASACGGCALALNPATTPQASTTASSSAASGPHTLSGMLIYVGQTLANWAFGWIALLTAIGAAVCAEVASCPAAAAILVVVAAFAAAVALAGNVLEGLGNVIRGMPFLLSVILLALVVAILVAIMYTVYMLLMQALLQAQAAAAAAGAAGTALWMGLITKILPGALLTVLFVPLLVISGIGGAVGACFLDPQCRSSATA